MRFTNIHDCRIPAVGTADAEMKVPPVENSELKSAPFKAMHATPTAFTWNWPGVGGGYVCVSGG